MEDNLKKFISEFEELKGQFVINESMEVRRFVAIASDDLDYYYVLYDGRKVSWHSCVGRIIPIKNRINDEDYEYIARSARLNHFDQLSLFGNKDENNEELKKFINEHKKEIEKTLSPNSTYLTEICWNIN